MSDELARKKFTEFKERAGQRLVTGPERFLIPDADLDGKNALDNGRYAYFYLERV